MMKSRFLIAGVAVAVVLTLPAASPQVVELQPGAVEPQAGAGFRVALPEPTGRYAVGTTELHLVDQRRADPWVPDRRRELMVSAWYPTRWPFAPFAPYLPLFASYMPPRVGQAIASQMTRILALRPEQVDFAGTRTHARAGAPVLGRHPVVLYSPGMGLSRLSGTHQVEDLASQGYVVVTIDHTGEAPVEFPGGRLTEDQLPLEIAPVLDRRATAVRAEDTRFVLDQLAVLRQGGNPDAGHRALPHGLGHALDLSRTGMFGFSLGGLTAGEVMLHDRRVDAGVNMDGTMMYDPLRRTQLSDVAQQGLDRPFLLMGAMDHHHRDLSWTTFWQRQRGWKLGLDIPAGTHGAFVDYQFILPQLAAEFGIPANELAFLVGAVDPVRSVAAQRGYLTAFFDRFLRDLPQPLLDRESLQHPDIRFIR